ncbi:TolB family protein [Streptosporangium canum]|uniref:TolB family protein n=1 Tax=Streptosporangium canum TaxID=324952 RepID=UPI0037B951DD
MLTDSTSHAGFPSYSPDGKQLVYRVWGAENNGTGLGVLTGSSGANEGHAAWNPDGRILYNSGMYGFREEAALYDNTFQPYGQIFIMNADGSGKKMPTDSIWEDSMPIYLPDEVLAR